MEALLNWLGSEGMRTYLLPALVAAGVALAFEVVFKPAIAVRTERRVAEAAARRAAISALRAVASRADVVRLTSGVLLRLLKDEVGPLLREIDEVRNAMVRGPSWTKRQGRVATRSLAVLKGCAVAIDMRSQDIIAVAEVGAIVGPHKQDLETGARGLELVAESLATPWWRPVGWARSTWHLWNRDQDKPERG